MEGDKYIYKGSYTMWKFNPRSRTITLTKLLIKHAIFHKKKTEIGALHNPVLNKRTSANVIK